MTPAGRVHFRIAFDCRFPLQRISLRAVLCLLSLLSVPLAGCGTTKQNMATEQMLNSDAVDAAVAKIDFTPLAGQKVFFDTKYMVNYKGVGFVTSDYVISSLRQQMAAAGLLLMDSPEQADYVLEGRVGVLGTDAHELVYGIPSNSALGSAASIAASATTGTPAPATIPELSVARRNDQSAASKIGVFAYDRVSREVVWQSGTSVARSTARDLWFFGVGPFQKGSIYKNKLQFVGDHEDYRIQGTRTGANGIIASYTEEKTFVTPGTKREPTDTTESAIQQVSGETSEGNEEASEVESAEFVRPIKSASPDEWKGKGAGAPRPFPGESNSMREIPSSSSSSATASAVPESTVPESGVQDSTASDSTSVKTAPEFPAID